MKQKWQNKGGYSNYNNRDSHQKSKFEISKKCKYKLSSNNKTPYGKYSKEEVADLIKATVKHIMQQNLPKDVKKSSYSNAK